MADPPGIMMQNDLKGKIEDSRNELCRFRRTIDPGNPNDAQ